MRTLNLGILAHVDAGKTSLTERLLYAAGAIDHVGSVDDGSTQTDTLALERQRGITIRSAVVAFRIGDVAVNLIDTPGHPDFIAEVERVLSVLDGAVLVVSAVEGVQAQTRVLMRALQRLRVPTLLFVNKIDRGGAEVERVLRQVAERLTPAIVPMGSASALGTREAMFAPYGEEHAELTNRLADVLTANDDALLAAYVADDAAVSYRQLREALVVQTARARVHPVFCGSAITGAGVEALMAVIAELLPATEYDPDGPLSATVFKIERNRAGAKVAYARLFAGRLRAGVVRRGEQSEGHQRRGVRAREGASGGLGHGRRDRQGLGSGRRPSRGHDRSATAGSAGPPLRAADARGRDRAAPTRGEGCVARRPRPARRAGPADQPAAGRQSR
jgi:ribosomal protection tetracycline resistance protein